MSCFYFFGFVLFVGLFALMSCEDTFKVDYTCKDEVPQAFCLPANYSKMDRFAKLYSIYY